MNETAAHLAPLLHPVLARDDDVHLHAIRSGGPFAGVETWIERGLVRIEVWGPNDPRIIRSNDDNKRPVQVAVLLTGLLRDYEMQQGEQVSVEAALWSFEQRQRPERSGLLTRAAWCVVCGRGCLDTRPNPSRIRQCCDVCSKRRARPGLRWCAAQDCPEYFLATHAAGIYCSDACAKAEQRRARSALAR